MKIKSLLFTVLVTFFVFSCVDETEINDSKNKKIANRELGQIPSETDFFKNYLNLVNSEASETEYISFLKEIKKNYNETDYYNNMFEIASSELFQHKNFNKLNNEDLNFILDEMRTVGTNILNIKNIPLIIESLYKNNVINKAEAYTIASELILKNKQKIEKFENKDIQFFNEKMKEIDEVSLLYYARAAY